MRAFHVVGVNLQGRHGVHHRIVAEQQRLLVCLESVFCASLADEDLALEHAGRFAAQHVLVKLVARAVRGGVIEQRVVVHVLLAAEKHQAVERGIGVFAGHDDVQIIARKAADRRRVRNELCVAAKMHLHRRDVIAPAAFLLELAMVDAASWRGDDFGDGIGEVDAVGPRRHSFRPRRLRRLLRRPSARADARRSARRLAMRDEQQVNRPLDDRAARKWMKAPSRMKPVFRATNGFCFDVGIAAPDAAADAGGFICQRFGQALHASRRAAVGPDGKVAGE